MSNRAIRLHVNINSFSYGRDTNFALTNIHFRISAGTVLACLGASGSGKSTLLRLLAGLDVPEDGRVAVNGIDIVNLRPSDRRVGLIPQHLAIYPHLSVKRNIELVLRAQGIRGEKVEERRRQVLSTVGLASFAGRRAGTLSGGERQRVALGRILALRPKILCLDEPLSNVDAAARPDLLALVRNLHDELQACTIFVTHSAVEALSIADYISILDEGEQVAFGVPEDVYRSPPSVEVFDLLDGATSSKLGLEVSFSEGRRLTLSHSGVSFGGTMEESRMMEVGRRVVVGVRPELVGRGNMDQCAGRLTGTVEECTFLGDRFLVRSSTAVGEVRFWNSHRLDKGAQMQLTVGRAQVPAFDPATGRRLFIFRISDVVRSAASF